MSTSRSRNSRAQELRVITEVKQAEKEYSIARSAVERMERMIRPGRGSGSCARPTSDGGAARRTSSIILAALRDYNEFVRQYLTDILRYRRSMLRLNTVTGQRLLP